MNFVMLQIKLLQRAKYESAAVIRALAFDPSGFTVDVSDNHQIANHLHE